MRKILPLLVLACAFTTQAEQHQSHWGYEGAAGPDQWGNLELDFATCKKGKQQSPIELSGAEIAKFSAPQLNYAAQPLKLTNNGHTLVQDVSAAPAHMSFGGQDYNLKQFHFHTPSEHHLNGKSFPMELHFVHSDADGQLAVVGVFVQQGTTNSTLQQLLQKVPLLKDETVADQNSALDLFALMPAEKHFYHYMGSLTTPPCTENVHWLVLNTPIEASAEQLKQLNQLVGNNSRPVQNLNARTLTLTR
ncbi:carbonic anhydrase [Rheinheimera sp.]|uniref:carbonic anhydrase n=1 Tax=Rheinheimera sp. TaxID=1869214 RepID=UPI0026243FF8|nr:carbonic anhydrase family protein [Rheinheimera sp.]MCA1930394.1 carbonic anhydrase family protein [Rheinheimera sp.]